MEPLELYLNRFLYTPRSTTGILSISTSSWFMLEDAVRKIKVPHITAIPAGRYKIVPWVFGSLNQIRPMLLNVPQYSGIFMHPGNKPDDTDGCLLPGKIQGEDTIFQSSIAYGEISYHLCEAWGTFRETWINVIDVDDHPWFDDVVA